MDSLPVNCLIAEHDEVLGDLLETTIARDNLSITRAKDGEQALDKIFKGERVDILVTNLYLPRVSGDELIRKVYYNSPQIGGRGQ